MLSLCPQNTNGLRFQLILLVFKRKEKGRHQHWLGGSGNTLQKNSPLNIVRGNPNSLTGSHKPVTYVGYPLITDGRYDIFEAEQ